MTRSTSLVLAPDNTLRFFEYSSISDSVYSPSFTYREEYDLWMKGYTPDPLNCPHYADPTTVFRIAMTDYGLGSFFAVRYCPICCWVHLPDYFDSAWRMELDGCLFNSKDLSWRIPGTNLNQMLKLMLIQRQSEFDKWLAERKTQCPPATP